ncbi:MAG: hypothetical protein PHP42_05610 [Bacteroidota bacterium]|nr:hypothetical protein [Bacteroidota bacterium]
MGTGSYNIIPEGESHCVWMDAGLVNYKLCDKNFECESCEFDKIMRTQHHPFSERAVMQSEPTVTRFVDQEMTDKVEDVIVTQLIRPLQNISLPDDRMYFRNHTWLQRMDDGSYKIGVDSFIAELINPLVGVVVINTPSKIEKDSPYAWLIRDDETFTLYNPLAGTAISTNPVLNSKPITITQDPYAGGWIMTITTQQEMTSLNRCYTAEEFQYRIENDLRHIKSLLHLSLKKQQGNVGSTSYDGGVRVETIEQFIGEKRYMQLLSRLIRPH